MLFLENFDSVNVLYCFLAGNITRQPLSDRHVIVTSHLSHNPRNMASIQSIYPSVPHACDHGGLDVFAENVREKCLNTT